MNFARTGPRELHGTRTCSACGCLWVMFDLSKPNPIEPLCYEVTPGRYPCDCHNPDWVAGYLDERARQREEVVLEI